MAEVKPKHPAYYPVLKANYTYAIPTAEGTLTVSLSVPSVLPMDIDDGHAPIAQPVFARFTLTPDTSRAALELDLPLRAADPLTSRFRDPTAAPFVERFARAVMSVSACHGGEIGTQSVAGRYRMTVAEREARKTPDARMKPNTAHNLPIRMERRGERFIVWKADMTCSFWRNPAAQRQLAQMHEGLQTRQRDPLEVIRAARIWATASHNRFGLLPKAPAPRIGPRWGDPSAAGLYVATLPGVPREPGLLRATPR